jgi:hypothetical protein
MLELFDCFDTQELMEDPDAYIVINFHDDDTITEDELAVVEETQLEFGMELAFVIVSWTHEHLDNIPQNRFVVTYKHGSEFDRRVANIYADMVEAKENEIRCANGECDNDCPCRALAQEEERRRQMPDLLSDDSDCDTDDTVYSSDSHYQTGTASQPIIRAKPLSRRERRAKNGAGKASTRDELTDIAVRIRTRAAAKHPSNSNQAMGRSRGILQHTDMINTVANVYANPHVLD